MRLLSGEREHGHGYAAQLELSRRGKRGMIKGFGVLHLKEGEDMDRVINKRSELRGPEDDKDRQKRKGIKIIKK